MARELSSEEIISGYYDAIKDTYPHLTYQQIKDICKTQYDFTRIQMARRDMPTISVKFLGKFRVFPSAVQEAIVENRLRKIAKIIPEDVFNQRDREYRGRLIRILLHNEKKEDDLDTEDEDVS